MSRKLGKPKSRSRTADILGKRGTKVGSPKESHPEYFYLHDCQVAVVDCSADGALAEDISSRVDGKDQGQKKRVAPRYEPPIRIPKKSVSLNIEPEILDPSNYIETEENPVQLETQAEEDDVFDGGTIFAFRTPKRTKASTTGVKTPKDSTSKTQTEDTKTPRKSTRLRKVESTTPYRLAKRNETEQEVDSDSSIEQSDGEQPPINQNPMNSTEGFFNAQSSKSVTSDHTLSRLREEGVFDQSQLRTILSSRTNHHYKDRQLLIKEYKQLFNKWTLQMCLGYNIILYGYGSKKNLIEGYRRTHLKDYNCVVINGYFPSITLKHIMLSIYDICDNQENTIPDSSTCLQTLHDYLQSTGEALFLIVHNIDGQMLRNSNIQNFLSQLSSIEDVHIIASIDHINSGLLWNQSQITRFRWIWFDCTTFEPYIEETSYENSLLTQQSNSLALKSMMNVYKSLTPNAQQIFTLLIKFHLDHCSDQSYIGMAFQTLYQKCRESFLVNSDQTLRTQLTEFRDHKLIKTRKGADGGEHIFLPIDKSTLTDFTEQTENT